jgi:anti-sigma B factor antagonist
MTESRFCSLRFSDQLSGETNMLEITVERTDDYAVCRPAGELDAYTVGQFREALAELAEEKRLLIDLSDVPFMDSAGLGALIGGIRRTRENEGEVAVACSRPTLTRLLHTTGFDRIVPVKESLEEAIEALNEPAA